MYIYTYVYIHLRMNTQTTWNVVYRGLRDELSAPYLPIVLGYLRDQWSLSGHRGWLVSTLWSRELQAGDQTPPLPSRGPQNPKTLGMRPSFLGSSYRTQVQNDAPVESFFDRPTSYAWHVSYGANLGLVRATSSSWGNDGSVYMVAANNLHHGSQNPQLVPGGLREWRFHQPPSS